MVRCSKGHNVSGPSIPLLKMQNARLHFKILSVSIEFLNKKDFQLTETNFTVQTFGLDAIFVNFEKDLGR